MQFIVAKNIHENLSVGSIVEQINQTEPDVRISLGFGLGEVHIINDHGEIFLLQGPQRAIKEVLEVVYESKPQRKQTPVIKEVTEKLDDFEPTKAFRPISDFVQNELSNWYVRLCRRRFWKGEMGQDKLGAYQTLYSCLTTIAKLIAPVAPFYADQLYQDLTKTSRSVHLSDFPVSNELKIRKDLERRMSLAQLMSSLVLSIRKKEGIRVRQPISRIIIPVFSGSQENDILAIKSLILSEVNAKEIKLIKEDSGIFVKRGKPNFKTLGRKAGKAMNEVAEAIRILSPKELKTLEENHNLDLKLSASVFKITNEDVDITTDDIPGMAVASEQGVTIAVDLKLSPELIQEGLAREAVNRIQTIRKEQNFDITDRINLWVNGDLKIINAIKAHSNYVSSEVLAISLNYSSSIPNDVIVSQVELDGHDMIFGLKK